MCYNYEMRYQKGNNNMAIDALSCIKASELQLTASSTISSNLFNIIQQISVEDAQI